MINIVNEFFNTNDFAQEAYYYADAALSVNSRIRVIYDSEYSVNILNNVRYQNAQPTAICRTIDIPDCSDESKLVIGGSTYYVLEVQAENTGTTTLILSKEAPHGQ